MTHLKSVSKQQKNKIYSIHDIDFSLNSEKQLSIKSALSICEAIDNSVSISSFYRKPCYEIDINGLNVLKKTKSVLKQANIFNPLEIPNSTPKGSYLEELYFLLSDMLLRIVNTGDRKLKSRIKSYEDSHLYNTLQLTIGCYEAILNTEPDFLEQDSDEFYNHYIIINNAIIDSITDTINKKESNIRTSTLSSLYTLRRGLNYKEERAKLLYLFSYKESLYNKIVESELNEPLWREIQKDYLIILNGATCSFNLKHMEHCAKIIADKIKGTS
jgi:hypothetical protein